MQEARDIEENVSLSIECHLYARAGTKYTHTTTITTRFLLTTDTGSQRNLPRALVQLRSPTARQVIILALQKSICSRCSFHAYADSTYAKHLESGASLYGTVGGQTPLPPMATPTTFGPGADVGREYQQSVMEMSDDSINSIERIDDYMVANGRGFVQNGSSPPPLVPLRHELVPNGTSSPNENGNIHRFLCRHLCHSCLS